MTCLAWFFFLAGLILFGSLFAPFIGGCLGLSGESAHTGVERG